MEALYQLSYSPEGKVEPTKAHCRPTPPGSHDRLTGARRAPAIRIYSVEANKDRLDAAAIITLGEKQRFPVVLQLARRRRSQAISSAVEQGDVRAVGPGSAKSAVIGGTAPSPPPRRG